MTTPTLPTSPEVLAEATPYSLNDLAIMSPAEMSPEAELAYIAHLRKLAEAYDRALGAKPARRPASPAKAKAIVTAVLDPTAAAAFDGEDLF